MLIFFKKYIDKTLCVFVKGNVYIFHGLLYNIRLGSDTSNDLQPN